METNFSVGDKVVCCHYGYGEKQIGTVVRVTEKRKDIIVDFGRYKETFGADGFRKSSDVWHNSYLKLLTPEIEEEIRRSKLIRECRNTFDEKCKHLTANQAEKILAILNEGVIAK